MTQMFYLIQFALKVLKSNCIGTWYTVMYISKKCLQSVHFWRIIIHIQQFTYHHIDFDSTSRTLNVARFINNNRSVSNIYNFGKFLVYFKLTLQLAVLYLRPNLARAFHISEIKSTRRPKAINSMMVVKVQCILIIFCVLTPALKSQRNKEFESLIHVTPNGGFVFKNDGEQNGEFVTMVDDGINFGETETNGPFDDNEGSGDDSAGHTSCSGAMSTLMILFPTFIARELIFRA